MQINVEATISHFFFHRDIKMAVRSISLLLEIFFELFTLKSFGFYACAGLLVEVQ